MEEPQEQLPALEPQQGSFRHAVKLRPEPDADIVEILAPAGEQDRASLTKLVRDAIDAWGLESHAKVEEVYRKFAPQSSKLDVGRGRRRGSLMRAAGIQSPSLPPQELEVAIKNASLGEIRDLISALHKDVLAWRETATEENQRADKLARKYLIWGAVLSIPTGLLGALIAWLIGIA